MIIRTKIVEHLIAQILRCCFLEEENVISLALQLSEVFQTTSFAATTSTTWVGRIGCTTLRSYFRFILLFFIACPQCHCG